MTAARLFEISLGDSVYAADGDRVGEVMSVRDDVIVVGAGELFASDTTVPTSVIAQVDGHRVYLGVPKDQVRVQAWNVAPVTDSPESVEDGSPDAVPETDRPEQPVDSARPEDLRRDAGNEPGVDDGADQIASASTKVQPGGSESADEPTGSRPKRPRIGGRLMLWSDRTIRGLALAREISTASGRAGPFAPSDLLAGLQVVDREGPVGVLLEAFGVDLLDPLRRSASASEPAWDLDDLVERVLGLDERAADELAATLLYPDHALNPWQPAEQQMRRLGSDRVAPHHVLAALALMVAEDGESVLAPVLGAEIAGWIRRLFETSSAESDLSISSLRARVVQAVGLSPALHDRAAARDALGFDRYAAILAELVLKPETLPPLVVGVYGPWGSGKSTLMGLVGAELESRTAGGAEPRWWQRFLLWKTRADPSREPRLPKVRIVRYDAWAYADAAKLWSGLVRDVAKELDDELGWRGRARYLWNHHGRRLLAAATLGLLPVATTLAALALGFFQDTAIASVSGLASLGWASSVYYLTQRRPVAEAMDALTSRFDAGPVVGVARSVQAELEAALSTAIAPPVLDQQAQEESIQERVRTNKLKLVVFIDELDRCPLDRIVDILEAIKLFLSREIFIVFLAVDTRVAAEAIRLRYQGVDPNVPREYLEKIVQLPLPVPTGSLPNIKQYLAGFRAESPATDAAIPADRNTGSRRSQRGAETIGRTREQSATDGGSRQSAATGTSTPPSGPAGERANRGRATAARLPAAPNDDAATLPKLRDTEFEFDTIAALAQEFLDGNPRRIKRLLNTYRYVKLVAAAEGAPVHGEAWQRILLTWLGFTMRWPSFMAGLVRYAEETGPETVWSPDALLAYAKLPAAGEAPDRAAIERHVLSSSWPIARLTELAGNFLIENPASDAPPRPPAEGVATRGQRPATEATRALRVLESDRYGRFSSRGGVNRPRKSV